MPRRRTRSESSFTNQVIDTIRATPLDQEVPAFRVKQIGMMMLLRRMMDDDIDTSVSNIVTFSGMSRQAVLTTMRPLVVEETTLNVLGKGHASRFTIIANLAKLM